MTCNTYLGVMGATLLAVSQIAPVVAQDDKSGSSKKTILVQTDLPGIPDASVELVADGTDQAC